MEQVETFEKIYHERMEEARKYPLPAENKSKFMRGVVKAFLRSIIIPGGHLTREMRDAVSSLCEQGVFQLCLDGVSEVADCDLFFGNHQGPKRPGGPQGGIEVLFSTQFVRNATRYVLRENLIEYRWSVTQCIKARATRKPNPIVVRDNDRLQKARDQKAPWAEIKQTAIGLKKERQRVAAEVFRAIDVGTPVAIYPEGTRSTTGRILPFVSDFMRKAITDYIVPRMLAGKPRRIGLIVAETLQTFPDGVGKGALLCDRPSTLKGVRYDTGSIEAEYRKMRHLKHKDYETAMTRLSRTLALSLRDTFEQELRAILQK
ncbi:MAG: hypothetical protein CMJ62_05820 [Planctomycetaceae bacterium]|nr:hypothetical protein [Planctomycetaceae bacterium]